MNLNSWLARPVWLLVVGLLLLAAALFYEWPGWWGGLPALAGVAVLAAWALGYGASRAGGRRTGDRRFSRHP